MRRRARLTAGLATMLAAGVALVVVPASVGPASQRRGPSGAPASRSASVSVRRTPRATPSASRFAVGLRVLHLLDTRRRIALPNGSSVPRTLVTYVRYPALAGSGGSDAPAARAGGPFPLVIFGHGFAVTPSIYERLLHSWAQAGYVVAAPVFPLENANAPGGPDESDLINQPADMSFVISRILAASSAGSGPLSGLVEAGPVAVTGQSDGGETALAVAYDSHFRDRRVGAAVILSGAQIPGVGGFTFDAASPPLLATQGTADTVNPPRLSNQFFARAGRPKYLLRLLGAGHLPPYTSQQPQLGIVERVSTAFLDAYLKHSPAALRRLRPLGTVDGTASLIADP